MSDYLDPVLEAVDALRAEGVTVEPEGDDLDRWKIGDFVLTDAEVLRLAENRGLVDGPGDAG